MKCPKCHTQIADNATSCWLCDYKLYPDNNDKIESVSENIDKTKAEISKDEQDEELPQNKKCPFCGEEILREAVKCKHCGEWLGRKVIKKTYTDNSTIPYSVKYRFNWGAFLNNWIWLLWYKKYAFAITCLICIMFNSVTSLFFAFNSNTNTPVYIDLFENPLSPSNLYNILTGIIFLAISIFIGCKGNEWAWESRRYRDENEFHTIQKRWIWLYLAIIFVIIFVQFIIALINAIIGG